MVRLGEKRILQGTLDRVKAVQRSLTEPAGGNKDKKRKVSGGEKKQARGKKAKQV